MRHDPIIFYMAEDPCFKFNVSEGDYWITPGEDDYKILIEENWRNTGAAVIYGYEEQENVETTGEAMLYPPNDLPAFMRMRITAMEMALTRVQNTGLIPATDELIDSAGKIYSFLTGGIGEQ